jgi:hypothetical protein
MKIMRSMAVSLRPVPGGWVVEEYRVCIVASDGHIKQRLEFQAPNDQAALEYARLHIGGDHAEAWLERVVAKLKPVAP